MRKQLKRIVGTLVIVALSVVFVACGTSEPELPELTDAQITAIQAIEIFDYFADQFLVGIAAGESPIQIISDATSELEELLSHELEELLEVSPSWQDLSLLDKKPFEIEYIDYQIFFMRLNLMMFSVSIGIQGMGGEAADISHFTRAMDNRNVLAEYLNEVAGTSIIMMD